MLQKKPRTTDLNKLQSEYVMKVIILSRDNNILTVKDTASGKIFEARPTEDFIVKSIPVGSHKPMISKAPRYQKFLKGRKMSQSLIDKIVESKKMFSKDNYDPEAVKAFNEQTGQNVSSDFRFTVNGEGSFLVSVEETYDREEVKNMTSEEQVNLLKSFFNDTPQP